MLLIALLVAVAWSSLSARAEAATVLQVTPGGGTYNSIQAAIAAAPITTDTVTIRIAAGVYHENLNISAALDLTLEGGWDPTFTTRDTSRLTAAFGDSYGSEIDIIGAAKVTMDGLTITRGNDSNGGGIDIWGPGADVRLLNSTVTRNDADANGGGISSYNSTLTLENSEVSDNVSYDDNDGGGLYVHGGTLVIKKSNILRNVVTSWGYMGGGMFLNNVNATISQSRIQNNTSFDSGGGGIAAADSDLAIVNSIISGNSTTDGDGGGLYYYQEDNGNALAIINSTITNNTAENTGGGAYIDSTYYGSVDIRNSVLWGNLDSTGTAPYFKPGDVYLNYDEGITFNISNSDIGAATGTAFSGPGNVSADPLFVDPGAANYHLGVGSAAIDTGAPVGAPAMDINSIARPRGAGFDMGAYEEKLNFDTIAPTVGLIAPKLASDTSKDTNFSVSWAGSDAAPSSGGLRYQVLYKIGAGGRWRVARNWTKRTSMVFHGIEGRTFYVRVRSRDAAGNVGSFSSVKKTIVPRDSICSHFILGNSGFYRPFVGADATTAYYNGTIYRSDKAGDSVSFLFKGKNIYLIGSKGPGMSKAKVYVDGRYAATVDAFAATNTYRRVLFARSVGGSGRHLVTIRNLATAGRPAFDIDAYGMLQ